MNKKIILYLIAFILVGAISFFLQSGLLSGALPDFAKILRHTYLYFGTASLGITVLLALLAVRAGTKDQIGLLYLALLVIKLLGFAAIFHPYILGDQLLTMGKRAALLWPMFVFLTLEVLFVVKNMQSPSR